MKLDIIKTDTQVPHQVPEHILRMFHQHYPEGLNHVQTEAIAQVERITKGIKLPDHVRTELVGALNAYYFSGYYHACPESLKPGGSIPDALRRR